MAVSCIAGVVNCRIRAKERGVDAAAGTTIFFFLLTAILFLAFGWNKLHMIWVLPVALFTIPFLVAKKIPIASPIALSATRIFQKMILVGIKPKIPDETAKIEDNKEYSESDEVNDNKDAALQPHEENKAQKAKNERIEKYKKIRATARNLTRNIMKYAPKFVLIKAAGDLNMRSPKGVFVFDSEEETNYLMDRCFYDIYWQDKSLIQHFIDTDEYRQLSEEEQTIVKGMRTTYYSLFEITDVNPSEATVWLKDLLGDMAYIVTDLSMSLTARKGGLLATRIKQIEGIYMLTGAGCPFEEEHKEVLLEGLKRKTMKKGKKKRHRELQKSDYSAYFFRQYKRISGIGFMTIGNEEE